MSDRFIPKVHNMKPQKNVRLCIFLIAGYLLIYHAFGCVLHQFTFQNIYTRQLLRYFIMIPLLIVLVLRLQKQELFRFTWRSFGKGIFVASVYWCIAVWLAFRTIQANVNSGTKLLPWVDIMIYSACFLIGTGFTEEVLFRGIVLHLLEDKYGRTTRKNILKAMFVSSFLFGMIRFLNMFSSENADMFKGMVQVLCAFSGGLFFSAVYFRSRNIWCSVAIHGFWDFAMGIESGIFGVGYIMDLSSDDYSMLADVALRKKVIIYRMIFRVIWAIILVGGELLLFGFLMRKKKVQPLLDREEESNAHIEKEQKIGNNEARDMEW